MKNKDKIILDLAGGTGAWSKDYEKAGYDVKIITWPIDDVRLFPSKRSKVARSPKEFKSIEDYKKVYGILAAPTCSRFCGSGARWKRNDKEMIEALALADACLRIVFALNPKFWALENPAGKLRKWIGKPTMIFHPCDYGDPYTKRTCLWGKFNMPVKNPVEPTEGSKIHLMCPSKDREMLRSITPPGFAKAFYEANK